MSKLACKYRRNAVPPAKQIIAGSALDFLFIAFNITDGIRINDSPPTVFVFLTASMQGTNQ